MEIHVLLRRLALTVGSGVFRDPDGFQAAFDDYLPDGAASAGEVNLIVDAVRLGAHEHLMRLLNDGASPSDAVDEAGRRLASVRGSTDLHGAMRACALLGYAAGVVSEVEVRRYATESARQATNSPDSANLGETSMDAIPRHAVIDSGKGAPAATTEGPKGGPDHRDPLEQQVLATNAVDADAAPEDHAMTTSAHHAGIQPEMTKVEKMRHPLSAEQAWGRSRATSSWGVAKYVIALGVVALLAIVAVVSYRDRQSDEASGSEPNDQAVNAGKTNDLQATLIFVPDFHPQIAPTYMMPDYEADPPSLPVDLKARPPIASLGSTRYNEWHERQGGIPVEYQTVRLVLGGRDADPVVVTRIQPFVVTRDPPVPGWMFLPEAGAGLLVRYAEANLDCPEYPATLFVPDPDTGELINRKTRFDLEVSRDDLEEVELTVYSTRSYVRWGVSITYLSLNDGVQTMEVSDPRMQVTGFRLGSIRTYTYFPPEPRDNHNKKIGLIRTPQFDLTKGDVRFARKLYARRLCK